MEQQVLLAIIMRGLQEHLREHAVSIRRSKNGTLWLYDSLEEVRKRVSVNKLPSAFYNISPFVLIMKNDFVFSQLNVA